MYSTLREYMGLLHNYQQLHLCCSASAHDNMTLPTIYNHTEYCLIVYVTNLCNCNVTPFLFIWILVLPLLLVMYYSSLSIWVDSMHMCDVLTTWLFFLAITLRYSVRIRHSNCAHFSMFSCALLTYNSNNSLRQFASCMCKLVSLGSSLCDHDV